MATIPASILPVGNTSLQGWQVTWGPMANGDIGSPVGSLVNAPISFGSGNADLAGFADHTVQVAGVFGVAGNLAWEGSNDGVNFGVMTDPYSNVLNFTVASRPVQQWTEATISVRPHVTAGDGTTALIVTAFFRRTFQQPGFQV